MQRNFYPNGRLRLVATVALLALIGGCTAYKPLDRGAAVPWAKAYQKANEPEVARGGGPAPVLAGAGRQYRVRRGDRLSDLARAYGVSVQTLAAANQLEPPYVIYVGQLLRVPAPGESERTFAALADGERYRVRSGESLSAIARRVGVPLQTLAVANGLEAPYRVYAGQVLVIPHGQTVRPAPVQTVGRKAPVKVAAVQPTATKASTASPKKTKTASARPQQKPQAKAKKAIKTAELPATPASIPGDGFLWPVNGKVVGSFGPIGKGQRRDGIDIAARKGAPVLAADDGVVVYAGDGIRGYGRMVLVRHKNGYVSTYAYNSALMVEEGDVVKRGQVIARVGDTGDATRPMLHFELRKGREPINPETVLVRSTAPTAVASK